MYRLLHLLVFVILLSSLTQPGLSAEHGVIVLYHHVAEDTPPSTTIVPDEFRRHLEHLRDNGFNVMALDHLLASLRERQEIPDKSIAITFDDGFSSVYQTAFPMLQEFGFPFTVFISTQPINDSQVGYMSWAQVQEMADSGVVIANHMVNHSHLLDRPANESQQSWIQQLREELLLAEQQIATHTGQSHRLLAYPYGEFNPAIKDLLAEEGFIGLAQNSGAVGFDADFLALPRYPLASVYADLETASTKFDSLAFHVLEQVPVDPVTDSPNPTVRLRFGEGDYSLEEIGCFADGQPIAIHWLDQESGLMELAPQQRFSGRRWRYTCTAPAPDRERYYWYSVQWINPNR